jgi:hypothetical protein
MNPLPPILTVNCSCDEAARRINRSLAQNGLRVLETFDLQDARLGAAGCTCPHHGTHACDCQMVVLMVYGEAIAPTTLTLHGNDGRTSISLGSSPTDADEMPIWAAIDSALQETSTASGL